MPSLPLPTLTPGSISIIFAYTLSQWLVMYNWVLTIIFVMCKFCQWVKNPWSYLYFLFALQAARRILWDNLFPKYKIHEYYLLHVDDTVNQFRNAIKGNNFIVSYFVREIDKSLIAMKAMKAISLLNNEDTIVAIIIILFFILRCRRNCSWQS